MSIPWTTIERAKQADILEVARRRGAVLESVTAVEWVGPCLICADGHDRFSINTRKRIFNCRICGGTGDVIEFVRLVDRCEFREAVERLTGRATEPRQRLSKGGEVRIASDLVKAAGDARTTAERNAAAMLLLRKMAAEREEEAEVERQLAKAQGLWRKRRPIAGTIAETYLRQARGYAGVIQPTIGFLPSLGDHPPALIAAFGIATEPEPGALAITDADIRAVQLVKLKPDGSGKADIEPNKITIGQSALGVPIVLAPPNDLLGLAIAEGIEDALSVHQATGLGAWASGGAGRMPALADAVPAYIDFVTIVADRDPAGIKHSRALADRLRERGIEHAISFLDGEPT